MTVISENATGYDFPLLPGTYALVCQLEEGEQIEIGKLGSFFFESGTYIYVGSALGSGGLAGRLNRHLRRDRHVMRWHIDYLTAKAPVVQVWYCQSQSRYEHVWARHLADPMADLPEFHIPAPRFGASDCRCRAHLFYFGGQTMAAAVGEGLDQGACQTPGLIVVDV